MTLKIIHGSAALAAALIWAALVISLSSPKAPEVRFTSLSNETFSTSELRGKVVLVNFWATYCASCVQEMPRISKHTGNSCRASRR